MNAAVGRSLRAGAIAVGLASALVPQAGCLVVALHPFYSEAALTFDERLLGKWLDADDNVTVTVERGEWRSYRVQYTYLTDTRFLTAYLFKAGDRWLLDLSTVRGEDPGSFLLAGHALARLSIGDGEVRVAGLNYDWFLKAADERSLLPELFALPAERGQVVLAAGQAAIARWLAAQVASTAIWSEDAVFRREKSGAVGR